MAKLSWEGCRIRDDVRDSKIRWDIPSKPYQKFGSFIQAGDGLRHHPEHGYNQLGRDFPRTAAGGVGEGHLHCSYTLKECNNCWVRNEVPMFRCTSHIEDFYEWVDVIEVYFDEENLPEELKCILVSRTLEGEAEVWWRQSQLNRMKEGKAKISSWSRMKVLLFKYFMHIKCSTKCPSVVDSCSEDVNYGHNISEGRVHHIEEETEGAKHLIADEFMPTMRPTNSLNQLNKQDMGKEVVKHTKSDRPMLTICSMIVPSQLHSNGLQQIEDWSSKEEFPRADSSINDVPKVVECENVPPNALKYDTAIDTDKSPEWEGSPPVVAIMDDVEIDNFQSKHGSLQKDSRVHNLELEQSSMEESQLKLLEDLITPTLENSIDMLKKSDEQSGQQEVNEVKWMNSDAFALVVISTPIAFQFALINCRPLLEEFVVSSLAQRCEFVKVGTVRNGTTQFWMLHSRFGTCIKVVMHLFDPGGSIYLLDTWGFKDYLLSCSNRLYVRRIDAIIFISYSDGVNGIFAGSQEVPIVGKLKTQFRVVFVHSNILWTIIQHSCMWSSTPLGYDVMSNSLSEGYKIAFIVKALSPHEAPKKVSVDFGGDTPERQTSMMSGTNVSRNWRDLEVILCFLAEPMQTATSVATMGSFDNYFSHFLFSILLDCTLPQSDVSIEVLSIRRCSTWSSHLMLNGRIDKRRYLLASFGTNTLNYSTIFVCSIVVNLNAISAVQTLSMHLQLCIGFWDLNIAIEDLLLHNSPSEFNESCVSLLKPCISKEIQDDHCPWGSSSFNISKLLSSLCLTEVHVMYMVFLFDPGGCPNSSQRYDLDKYSAHGSSILSRNETSSELVLVKEAHLEVNGQSETEPGVESKASNVTFRVLKSGEIIKDELVSTVEEYDGLILELAGHCVIFGATGTEILGVQSSTFQFLWDELYTEDSRIYTISILTHRRVVLRKGWNNVNDSNGQFRNTLKLFHKLVNGLDPPIDVNAKLGRSQYGFLRVRSRTSFLLNSGMEMM